MIAQQLTSRYVRDAEVRGDQRTLSALARARRRDHQYPHPHLLIPPSRPPPAVRAWIGQARSRATAFRARSHDADNATLPQVKRFHNSLATERRFRRLRTVWWEPAAQSGWEAPTPER